MGGNLKPLRRSFFIPYKDLTPNARTSSSRSFSITNTRLTANCRTSSTRTNKKAKTTRSQEIIVTTDSSIRTSSSNQILDSFNDHVYQPTHTDLTIKSHEVVLNARSWCIIPTCVEPNGSLSIRQFCHLCRLEDKTVECTCSKSVMSFPQQCELSFMMAIMAPNVTSVNSPDISTPNCS